MKQQKRRQIKGETISKQKGGVLHSPNLLIKDKQLLSALYG